VPRGARQAFFGGWREVPVYALDALQPGHSLNGPAIIEAETTTVLVDTGDRVSVNALGWLDITLR
jgi:N-methylhydantoinase A